MRLVLRGRGPRALGAAVLRLGLIGSAALAAAAAAGCGRIGYDPLPEAPLSPDGRDGAPHPPDATQSSEGGGVMEASEEPSDEAGGDATTVDATPGVDALPGDENLDATTDATCTPSAPVDYCQVIPPLPAPPVIDGVLDCGPTLVPIVPEDWRGAAPLPPFPAGNTAKVAAAWRPDGLYVFISVTTPVVIPADPSSQDYLGAGVEIFVDDDGTFTTPGKFDDPGSSQMIVPTPALSSLPVCPSDASADALSDATTDAAVEGSADAAADAPAEAAVDAPVEASWNGPRGAVYRNEGLLGPWMSTQFGTFLTSTGFVFEGFVSAADLGLASWTLAAGSTVGFDVAVDVSFPDYCTIGLEGHRAGQYFLHVGTNPATDAATDAAADAAEAADAAADADADADAAPPAPPIGAPYEDSRSFCTPTLSSM